MYQDFICGDGQEIDQGFIDDFNTKPEDIDFEDVDNFPQYIGSAQ